MVRHVDMTAKLYSRSLSGQLSINGGKKEKEEGYDYWSLQQQLMEETPCGFMHLDFVLWIQSVCRDKFTPHATQPKPGCDNMAYHIEYSDIPWKMLKDLLQSSPPLNSAIVAFIHHPSPWWKSKMKL